MVHGIVVTVSSNAIFSNPSWFMCVYEFTVDWENFTVKIISRLRPTAKI